VQEREGRGPAGGRNTRRGPGEAPAGPRDRQRGPDRDGYGLAL